MCKTVQEYQKVSEAKGLAKYFSVDVVIKLFGVIIWEYHFPPQNYEK